MGLLSPVLVMVVSFLACVWCALERAPLPFALCALCLAVGVYELHASMSFKDVSDGGEG